MIKWIFLCFAVSLSALVVSSVSAAADNVAHPKEVTIGFTPSGNPEQIKKAALSIATSLQEELGLPVNIYLSKNYSGLIEAMSAKKVDFAFFTSMSFVFAEKKAGAKVLLKKVWEEPFYYSAIITKKGSGIRSISDLKNKKIAFVDEKSTSGYLYPLVMLKKNKIDPKSFKEVIFSGSHSESIRLLQDGKVDVAAVFSDSKDAARSAWTKYGKNKSSSGQIRVLWLSEPIPNDPFCVRQDFYDQFPKFAHSLMFSLVDTTDKLIGNPEFKEFMSPKGLVPATTRQYDTVREMVKELDLKVE